MIRRPPRSTLFPYTTLFRSRPPGRGCLGSCSRLSGAIVYFVADPERIKREHDPDRKSTRLNSSHGYISYAVFCLKKKKKSDGEAAAWRVIRSTKLLRLQQRV